VNSCWKILRFEGFIRICAFLNNCVKLEAYADREAWYAICSDIHGVLVSFELAGVD
jgi:hypothetical protein